MISRPGSTQRPARKWLLCLTVAWLLVPMSLLGLDVDWQQVCSCKACPLSAGPNCCCNHFLNLYNADGSLAKRVGIKGPGVTSNGPACAAGDATLSPANRLYGATPVVCQVDSVAGPVSRTLDVDTHGRRQAPVLCLLLPRPPPA